MSAKKRTSLDALFAVEEQPALAPSQTREGKGKPEASAKPLPDVARQERAGEAKQSRKNKYYAAVVSLS